MVYLVFCTYIKKQIGLKSYSHRWLQIY